MLFINQLENTCFLSDEVRRNQFCPSGASCLPMMRKQRSPVGQAACPFKDIKPLCLKFENNTQHPY